MHDAARCASHQNERKRTSSRRLTRSNARTWLDSQPHPRLFPSVPRGFYPPAQTILSNASSTRSAVRNYDQCLIFVCVPKYTQFRFYRLVLPQTHGAMKALPWLTHQLRDRETLPKLPLGRPTLAGMLSRNPKQVMPLIPLAQLYHGKAAKSAIADHRTIPSANLCPDALEEFADPFPE